MRLQLSIAFTILTLFTACTGTGGDGSHRNKSADEGAQLFSRYGCATCHSMEGEVLFGPPLNEIWKKRVEVIRDGKVLTLKANRSFLTRSVVDPGYEKASGYANKAMPKTFLAPDETKSIVDYIITMNKAGK